MGGVESGREPSLTELEGSDNRSWARKFFSDNYGKLSILLGMGTASGLANIEHGTVPMLTAGGKQLAYSTISGLVLLRIYNALAENVETLAGEIVPVVIPTAITIGANYGVHCLRGTAEPELSTLPTAITASVGFPIWHLRTRILELWKDIEGVGF